MKKLKTVSVLSDVFFTRPLFIIAILILLSDVIYVNLFWKYQNLSRENGEYARISGYIKDKAFDADGKVKSVVVENTMCYVNNVANASKLTIGSYVTVSGALYEYEEPMNYGEFNQRKYYASKRIYYYAFIEKAEIKKTRISIKEKFLNIRNYLSVRVIESCPLEYGTINTLLLADKAHLSETRKDLYTRAGVGHFLVISGLHISAIGAFIYKVMRYTGLKKEISCGVSIAFLFTYGLVVGFSVSVVRALIMYTVRLCADIFKETYDFLSSVSFALIITILINPCQVFDSAFAYSYGTVFSLAFYSTFIQKKGVKKSGVKGYLKELLRIPAVIMLFILPISLLNSSEYSIASVFVNAILTIFSGAIIFFAFSGLFGSILNLKFLAGLSDFLLALILKSLDFLCEISVKTGLFKIYGKPLKICVLLYFIFLFFYFFYIRKHYEGLIKAIFLCSLLLLLTFSLKLPTLSMLYVGQGECIVIRTGTKSAVIVDCGSTTNKAVAKYTVLPFLKASGIDRIQGIFLTHSDADHGNGIEYLLSELPKNGILIKNLFLPMISDESIDSLYSGLEMKALREKIPVTYIYKGMCVEFNENYFYVFNPEKEVYITDSNAASLIMLYKRGDFDALLLGDATKASEEAAVDLINKKVTGQIEILKVSHHGSKTGTSEIMLTEFSFANALISAGINNTYGHPHKEVQKLLSKFSIKAYCTKDCGEIDVKISDGLTKSYKSAYSMR